MTQMWKLLNLRLIFYVFNLIHITCSYQVLIKFTLEKKFILIFFDKLHLIFFFRVGPLERRSMSKNKVHYSFFLLSLSLGSVPHINIYI